MKIYNKKYTVDYFSVRSITFMKILTKMAIPTSFEENADVNIFRKDLSKDLSEMKNVHNCDTCKMSCESTVDKDNKPKKGHTESIRIENVQTELCLVRGNLHTDNKLWHIQHNTKRPSFVAVFIVLSCILTILKAWIRNELDTFNEHFNKHLAGIDCWSYYKTKQQDCIKQNDTYMDGITIEKDSWIHFFAKTLKFFPRTIYQTFMLYPEEFNKFIYDKKSSLTSSMKESMQFEWCRLSSFAKYPQNGISVIRLAEAGFHYEGNEDEVVCSFCGLKNKNWKNANCPKEIHTNLSPSCPFVLKKLQQTLQSNFSSESPTGACGNQGNFLKTVLSKQSYDENKSGINNTSSANSNGIQNSYTNRENSEGHKIEQTGFHGTDLTKARLPSPQIFLTFQSIPSMDLNGFSTNNVNGLIRVEEGSATRPSLTVGQPLTHNALVTNGNTASSQASNLTQNTDFPVNNIDNLSMGTYTGKPKCPANNLNGLMQIPESTPTRPSLSNGNPATMGNDQRSSSLDSNLTQMTNSPAANVDTMSMGICTDKPKYPKYAVRATRLSSFANWPSYLEQTAEELSLAGFFYTGIEDHCRCFFCGGGLRRWEPRDLPWTEHARWYPKCSFLTQCKGEKFIKDVQHGRDPKRAQIGESTKKGESIRGLNDYSNNPAVQTILELGFQPDVIKDAYNSLSQSGIDDITASLLVERIYEKGESFDPKSMIQYVSNENTQRTAQNISNDNTQYPSLKGTETNLTNTPNVDPNLELSIASLEEENRNLKDQQTCKICLDEPVSIVFLPCGHMAACINCAPALRRCPICRTYIKGTVKAIMC